MPIVAEAVMLLDILKTISNKSKHILYGSIIVLIDNLLLARRINNKIEKTNLLAQNTEAKITLIKEIIKETAINIMI